MQTTNASKNNLFCQRVAITWGILWLWYRVQFLLMFIQCSFPFRKIKKGIVVKTYFLMTNKRDSKVMFLGGLDLGLATTTCNMCRHTDITFSYIYVCIYIYKHDFWGTPASFTDLGQPWQLVARPSGSTWGTWGTMWANLKLEAW